MIAEHAIVADLERRDARAVAIARFERRDRLAPVARGLAQSIECGVIAFGDIAALRGIDRRGFDQRARQFIDERAMTIEPRKQPRKQWRQIGAQRKPLAQEACTAERIAKLRQIARPAAPRDETPERAARVGQRAQSGTQIGAPQGIARQRIDEIEPIENRTLVGERTCKVVGKQPRPPRGHRTVDRAEQAAVARTGHGADKLQALARRCVDRHPVARAVPHGRLQKDHPAGADMVEIGGDRAHGGDFTAREIAEAVERLHPEQRLEPFLPRATRELGGGAANDLARRRRRLFVRRLADQQFGRGQPRQFGIDRFAPHRNDLEPPGRDIGGGDGDQPFAADFGKRRKPVRAAPFEQRLFGQRARRDEAHDVARDERLRSAARLGLGGGFDLFGDRDAVAGADQAGEIGFGRMDGDAAHRHRLAAMLAARGQRDVERGGRCLGIVKKQFEEIAHAVEEQAIAGLFLQRPILRHHRRRGGRGLAVAVGGSGNGHPPLLSDWGSHGKARGPETRGSISPSRR